MQQYQQNKKNKENDQTKEKKVYEVFESISDGYDDANKRISLGMEKYWKKQLIKLFHRNENILDVCCGTGDIAIALKQKGCILTGLDFSPSMLSVAKRKEPGINWIIGNATDLPFPDNSFDGASISFGLRNTPSYEKVLSEMKRVVKDGGCIACLDSFVPENDFIRFFYNIYFKGIMPYIGGKKEHKEEYDWLASSTEAFLRNSQLKDLFEKTGIQEIKVKKMMCGACCLHYGKIRK